VTRAQLSIIMPAYNAERFIGEAIRSLFVEQDDVDLDVIVVSDGSTDRTDEIVSAIADANSSVRLLVEPHRGVAATRNVGVATARAPLIGFLDADDISKPGRLKRQSACFAAHPDTMVVLGDLMMVREIGADFAPVPGTPTWQLTGINLGTILFRREVFDCYGAFDESFTFGEDVDLLLRLWERNVPFKIEQEVAAFYRRHNANMTNDRTMAGRFLLKALRESMRRRRVSGLPLKPPPMFAERSRMEEVLARGK
jgi:glycosyltransferase involved in cell wall biosynthesis